MTNKAIQQEVHKLYYEELGITLPAEIDLEAIAFYKDAVVKRKPLSGCEARIIGADSRSVITVNSLSSPERQNFSIGHELGHWFKDRGKIGSLCAKTDMDIPAASKLKPRENIANQFASELILPHYLMKEALRGSDFSIDTVSDIKSRFEGSFMVTLRRTVAMNHHMGFFACYKRCGTRRYFSANKELPYSFLPPQQAPKGSAIHTLLKEGKELGATIIDGDVWCKDDLASGGVVHEHAFHYHEDEFLTIVWWKDEEPVWSHKETNGEF